MYIYIYVYHFHPPPFLMQVTCNKPMREACLMLRTHPPTNAFSILYCGERIVQPSGQYLPAIREPMGFFRLSRPGC